MGFRQGLVFILVVFVVVFVAVVFVVVVVVAVSSLCATFFFCISAF